MSALSEDFSLFRSLRVGKKQPWAEPENMSEEKCGDTRRGKTSWRMKQKSCTQPAGGGYGATIQSGDPNGAGTWRGRSWGKLGLRLDKTEEYVQPVGTNSFLYGGSGGERANDCEAQKINSKDGRTEYPSPTQTDWDGGSAFDPQTRKIT